MNSYDDKTTGLENPSHPAVNIEVFDEEIYSPQEIWIENKLEEIKNIKKLWDNMERRFNESVMLIASANEDNDSVIEYIKLKATLTHRLNRL